MFKKKLSDLMTSESPLSCSRERSTCP